MASQQVFYVTARDGRRSALLLGPYDTHEDALKNVDRARTYAVDHFAGAWFSAFGTMRGALKPGAVGRSGVLNELIGTASLGDPS